MVNGVVDRMIQNIWAFCVKHAGTMQEEDYLK
jgi:hypothetical protein